MSIYQIIALMSLWVLSAYRLGRADEKNKSHTLFILLCIGLITLIVFLVIFGVR